MRPSRLQVDVVQAPEIRTGTAIAIRYGLHAFIANRFLIVGTGYGAQNRIHIGTRDFCGFVSDVAATRTGSTQAQHEHWSEQPCPNFLSRFVRRSKHANNPLCVPRLSHKPQKNSVNMTLFR